MNWRQLMRHLNSNAQLAGGATVTNAPQAMGKAAVTRGMTRRAAVPDKWRNGAGRTEPDSGEFTPGLGGLS